MKNWYEDDNFKYIQKPSEELCLKALRQNAGVYKFIQNPTKKVTKYAIERNWQNLVFIEKQTVELCFLIFHIRKQ